MASGLVSANSRLNATVFSPADGTNSVAFTTVRALYLVSATVSPGGIAKIASTRPCASASGMLGGGIGTSWISSLRMLDFIGSASSIISGTVPGPRNASFFPCRSLMVLIGEFGITMIRSSGRRGVTKVTRDGAMIGSPREMPMMLGATPMPPTARLPAASACKTGANELKRETSTVSPSSLKSRSRREAFYERGDRLCSEDNLLGTRAAADSPRRFAEIDTVRKAVAVFRTSRRIG